MLAVYRRRAPGFSSIASIRFDRAIRTADDFSSGVGPRDGPRANGRSRPGPRSRREANSPLLSPRLRRTSVLAVEQRAAGNSALRIDGGHDGRPFTRTSELTTAFPFVSHVRTGGAGIHTLARSLACASPSLSGRSSPRALALASPVLAARRVAGTRRRWTTRVHPATNVSIARSQSLFVFPAVTVHRSTRYSSDTAHPRAYPSPGDTSEKIRRDRGRRLHQPAGLGSSPGKHG